MDMDKEVLYQLFEWTALPNSRVILIGIANALDLMDRILPRLQTHTKWSIPAPPLPPYTKNQIVTILQDRLGSNTEVVVDPMAVWLCAWKAQEGTGCL